MESTGPQRRLILPLGKYRVVERHGNTIKIELSGPYSMMVIVPDCADVRAGDILTFYTEVLYADPRPTSIQ